MIINFGRDVAPDVWGFIPSFLSNSDPRPAAQQFKENYVSGWGPTPVKFKFDPKSLVLSYPGDEPMAPLSVLLFRKEKIILYPSAWVVILQEDGSWEADRMD